jgi:type II secretory pathway component PulJ
MKVRSYKSGQIALYRRVGVPACRRIGKVATIRRYADTPTRRHNSSPGYLLLEVLLALAILCIVVVMIFQIVQATLRVTSDINFLAVQQERVDGVSELLRRNFVMMPQRTQFQTRTQNNQLQLIFRNAPFHFTWTRAEAQFGTVVLSARPQPDGRLSLAVLQDAATGADSYVDAGKDRKGDWIPIVTDIEQLSWRFFDSRTGNWSNDWRDGSSKPSLVELTYKLSGRGRLERVVFPWPTTQSNLLSQLGGQWRHE